MATVCSCGALTFLHGAEQVVKVLSGLVVLPLHLLPVVGSKLLGVLAVTKEVLVVELQVPDHQPVLVLLHALELREEGRGYVIGRYKLPAITFYYILK